MKVTGLRDREPEYKVVDWRNLRAADLGGEDRVNRDSHAEPYERRKAAVAEP